jgi:hypothetical protein
MLLLNLPAEIHCSITLGQTSLIKHGFYISSPKLTHVLRFYVRLEQQHLRIIQGGAVYLPILWNHQNPVQSFSRNWVPLVAEKSWRLQCEIKLKERNSVVAVSRLITSTYDYPVIKEDEFYRVTKIFSNVENGDEDEKPISRQTQNQTRVVAVLKKLFIY